MTIDDEEFFENLDMLIEHYKKDADGLCTRLIKCLPKENQKIVNKEIVQNTSDNDLCVIPEQELEVISIGKYEIYNNYLPLFHLDL